MTGCAGAVDDEGGGQGWPGVGFEDAAAEEAEEPGPVGAGVVVGGDVEAEPRAAVLHVGLKGGALGGGVREIVEPEDELGVGEGGGVQVVPVGAGGDGEVVGFGEGVEEGEGLTGEVDVIAFDVGGVESEDVGLRDGGRLREREGRQQQKQGE